MSCSQHRQLADAADQYAALETDEIVTWCGGCGNYGIQNALMRALTLEGKSADDAILCYDVGCSGNGSDKMKINTIHGLHGRVLPLAGGVALAQTDKTIVAEAGDGATFSEGVGHLVHAVRSDYPVAFLHHNNQNYALTTGQASSLTPLGRVQSAVPEGVYTPPLNHMELVLSLTPSFVARGFSGQPDQLTELIRAAIRHNGFAFIDILQACPTYNRTCTNAWYLQRLIDIKQYAPEHDVSDVNAARDIVRLDFEKQIVTGILHHVPRANYAQQMPSRHNVDSLLVDEVRHYDVSAQLNALT